MDYVEAQFWLWGDTELLHIAQGFLVQSCSPEFHQELRTCTAASTGHFNSHYFYSQECSYLPLSLQRCCSPAEKMTAFPYCQLPTSVPCSWAQSLIYSWPAFLSKETILANQNRANIFCLSPIRFLASPPSLLPYPMDIPYPLDSLRIQFLLFIKCIF